MKAIKRRMPSICALLVVLEVTLVPGAAWSEQLSSTQNDPQQGRTAVSGPSSFVEDIERLRILEQRRSTNLTVTAALITAVVGFATIAYNMRNANRQASLQAKLKAIDVVIAAAGPRSAQERLAVVQKLLGSDLALDTHPEDLKVAGVGPGHDQNRKDLIRMLADHPGREREILDLWEISFGKGSLRGEVEAMKNYFAKGESA